jgi:Carboxypeptidase regulatory-like domain
MRKRALHAFVLVALALPATTTAQQRNAAERGAANEERAEAVRADSAVIRGTVVDAQLGRPIASAVLYVMGDAATRSAESDARGRFSFSVPAPGWYRVQAVPLGYEAGESRQLDVAPGDTVDIELSLAPAPALLDSIMVGVERAARPLRIGEQLIQGVLVDEETGAPISAGTMRLENTGGAPQAVAVSDDDGRFRLVSPRPGTYRLSGERIGYRPAKSGEVHLMPGDTVVVEFRLAADAVLLEPIMVTGSARPWGSRGSLSGMREFFDRWARFGESGFGEFLTRDDIAEFEDHAITTAHMLLLNTLSVRGVSLEGELELRGRCAPTYYLDGMQVPFRPEVLPQDLEGVEIYNRPNIPADLNQGGWPCGVVAYWTRRSPEPDGPRRGLWTAAAVGTLGVIMLLLSR